MPASQLPPVHESLVRQELMPALKGLLGLRAVPYKIHSACEQFACGWNARGHLAVRSAVVALPVALTFEQLDEEVDVFVADARAVALARVQAAQRALAARPTSSLPDTQEGHDAYGALQTIAATKLVAEKYRDQLKGRYGSAVMKRYLHSCWAQVAQESAWPPAATRHQQDNWPPLPGLPGPDGLAHVVLDVWAEMLDRSAQILVRQLHPVGTDDELSPATFDLLAD